MSPKACVSHGTETRQVFGFDAPFPGTSEEVAASRSQHTPPGDRGVLTNGVGGKQPSPPQQWMVSGEGDPTSKDVARENKSKRKSSPPINTPHHVSQHH